MTRTVRDPESRAHIVEAARRAIASRGLRGATVRAVAAEAGVSTGKVMHYFGDRAALEAAVLAANNRRAGTRVQQASEAKRGLDALTAAVEAFLPLDAERRMEWQVWLAFWTSPAEPAGTVDDEAVRGRRAFGRTLVACLADAVADGELPAELDVPYEAERLVTLASGLGLAAGRGTPAEARRLAGRMLGDHVASLRSRPVTTRT